MNWRSYTSNAILSGVGFVSDGEEGGGGGMSDCVGIGRGPGGGSRRQVGGSGAPSDNALFENRNSRFEPVFSVGARMLCCILCSDDSCVFPKTSSSSSPRPKAEIVSFFLSNESLGTLYGGPKSRIWSSTGSATASRLRMFDTLDETKGGKVRLDVKNKGFALIAKIAIFTYLNSLGCKET